MKELNVNQLENLEGGKFWGWTCSDEYYIGGTCYQTCQHQVFWIVDVSPQPYACGEH